MPAQPNPEPKPIYTRDGVELVRQYADGHEIVELCDSHEELRKRHIDLIERTGPVDLMWNDPDMEPRRVAVAAEWPGLADALDAMRKPS